MLTSEVKQRINTCRDILVGKLPDPKSQVLQITNALIYKFMDDQDRQAERLGGKASFFINGLKPYAWHALFDSKLTNQEKADRYIEGIQKLSQAKHLPELFQEIFKEAFVPFRAAATITLFIDEINKFDYTHSEELGNAYEYLLNIMGTQADAGQFRTPRHIIEFIVDIVDPKKDETIYDPAVGTAGFLIAAYKHILEANAKLGATEKKRIGENITGVDISPDMAKIARVNLYLHGFKTPNISEGDTLTDENLWGKKHDVILANPPFMSPKGGIIPHDKHNIKSTRSEVLFVDYIAEHLKLKGRAGIIVPEGVIFQSGSAYKDLRRKLLEDDYLFAVISLPAGVFQPYSGVKTSILILDRERAKKTLEVLFLNIENEGFDLGATKRPINRNDLPTARDIFMAWRGRKKVENKLAVYVEKSKLAENGDYNLSGERYRTVTDYADAKWPMVRLGDVFVEIKNGKNVTQIEDEGKYRVSRIQTIAAGVVDINKTRYTNDEVNQSDFMQDGDILFSHINSIDHLAKTAIFENLNEKVVHGANLLRLRPDKSKILPRYALFIFKSNRFTDTARGFAQKAVNQASINSTTVKKFKIPLPPLGIQKEITADLERYQKVIDGARQVVENYKPSFKINPTWPIRHIGDLADLVTGGTPKSTERKYYDGDIRWLVSGDIHKKEIFDCEGRISKDGLDNSNARMLPVNSVLIALNGQGKTRGTVALLRTEAACNQSLVSINPKDRNVLLPEYLFYVLDGMYQVIREITGDNQRSGLNMPIIRNIKIPLPPIAEQIEIVDKLKEEQKGIFETKRLITIFEQKIQDKIAEVWGE